LQWGNADDLDSTLHQGKEITAVFEEIVKTLPSDHLKFSTVSAEHVSYPILYTSVFGCLPRRIQHWSLPWTGL